MVVERLLPDEFAFSQSSLQAYVDCERRFWLAYVEQLPWPAVEAAPIYEHEQLMRTGATFHRLIERNEIGLRIRLHPVWNHHFPPGLAPIANTGRPIYRLSSWKLKRSSLRRWLRCPLATVKLPTAWPQSST
jgi:hypothetical protein